MWYVWGRGEVHVGVWWGNLRERVHLEDPDVGRGIIWIIWIFKKWDGGKDWIDLAQYRDFCECGDEPSGPIKCGEFLG
jgi:hypothetical protein